MSDTTQNTSTTTETAKANADFTAKIAKMDPYDAAVERGLAEISKSQGAGTKEGEGLPAAAKPKGGDDNTKEGEATEVKTVDDVVKALADVDIEPTETEDKEDKTETAKTDGQVFKIKDGEDEKTLTLDEITDLAQKGFNYTNKTEKLKKQREDFESYKKEVTGELEQLYRLAEESVGYKKTWDLFLDNLKDTDETLHVELASLFKQFQKGMSNPAIDQLAKQNAELRDLILKDREGREKDHEAKELAAIRTQFESELKDVQATLGDAAKKLGLPIDWEVVKKDWIGSEGKAAFPTVKAAFLDRYGDALMKRYQSMAKVNQTKKVSASSKQGPTVGNLKNTKAAKDIEAAPKFKDYDEMIKHFTVGTGASVFG